MPNEVSHTEIWSQLQSGDQRALLALYNKYYLGLINFGMKLTGNRELTNDCITQVLLRLWDKRNELPPVENVRAYLLTCLRRELMAELKSATDRAVKGSLFQKNFGEAELPYEEYIIQLQTSKSLRDRLMKALDQLTVREKELLKLKFFEDLDYDEIASQCKISKRTAYNIIHAALKTLRTGLVDYQPTMSLNNPVLLVISYLVFFS
jgi:RNA polymerase sigma-70 factor (ECF subfamily)